MVLLLTTNILHAHCYCVKFPLKVQMQFLRAELLLALFSISVSVMKLRMVHRASTKEMSQQLIKDKGKISDTPTEHQYSLKEILKELVAIHHKPCCVMLPERQKKTA